MYLFPMFSFFCYLDLILSYRCQCHTDIPKRASTFKPPTGDATQADGTFSGCRNVYFSILNVVGLDRDTEIDDAYKLILNKLAISISLLI